ncbi:MAG: nicotinate-nucleotide adenylyltransferase [Candidatus Palauibacterales bacterium]|nr:nicotinate-nucleotide adenylyltransferase [Candidatus Palauibacterales bacterium]MDP2529867.1 nicotinate-nucleotide adenylyltransferase [Candidatus Palauibacterales bacterium]MDP2584725.1 nicotinate-nucleotide adenylyltransferase [Candidatus Palauibacterales bacterium]
MPAGERLGLFGGTFDPVHIGHLVVAGDVVEGLGLDRLLVVPAGRPPHRDAVLPAAVRLDLVRRAFDGDPRVEVSDVEVRRDGPSYTVDTLAWIRETRAPEALYLVLGVDQLRTLSSWHEPLRLRELAEIIVMTRGGERPVVSVADGVEVHTLPVTRVDLSATRIRERLGRGLTVRYLVPESVRDRLERAWSASAVQSAEVPEDRGNDATRHVY